MSKDPLIKIMMGEEVLYKYSLPHTTVVKDKTSFGESLIDALKFTLNPKNNDFLLEKRITIKEEKVSIEEAKHNFDRLLKEFVHCMEDTYHESPSIVFDVSPDIEATKFYITFGFACYEMEMEKNRVFQTISQIYHSYFIPNLCESTYDELMNQGILAISEKKYENAYHLFNQLYYWSRTKLSSTNVYTIYSLNLTASIHFINGRTEPAIACLKEAYDICRSDNFHDPDIKFIIYSNLGTALFTNQSYDDALYLFESAAHIGENNSNTAYIISSRFSEAVTRLSKREYYKAGEIFEYLTQILSQCDEPDTSKTVPYLTALYAHCYKISANQLQQELALERLLAENEMLKLQLDLAHKGISDKIIKILSLTLEAGNLALKIWLCIRGEIEINTIENLYQTERLYYDK